VNKPRRKRDRSSTRPVRQILLLPWTYLKSAPTNSKQLFRSRERTSGPSRKSGFDLRTHEETFFVTPKMGNSLIAASLNLNLHAGRSWLK